MKGWRPSAILKARNRIGPFMKRTHSCRTSDRSACLFPWGSRSPGCDPGIGGRHGSLRSPLEARGRQVGRKWRERPTKTQSAIRKMAPALHFLQETGGPKTKTEGTINSPNEQATPALRPRPEAGSGPKGKGRGGRRNPLIRLDSAKEMRDLNLDFLPPDLELLPIRLGFRSEKFGFRSGSGMASTLQSPIPSIGCGKGGRGGAPCIPY
jgi:hypothetical protein